VKIADLKSIHTAPFDATSGTWGIAVMRAAVNLPGSSAGQQVTLILYGDASLDSFSGDMQTVSIRTGVSSTPACDTLPPSGVTVQVPKGQHITFTVNGVQINLGSTAIIEADPQQSISIGVLEGQASVTAKGATEEVPAGRQVKVPLSNNAPSGVPGPVTK